MKREEDEEGRGRRGERTKGREDETTKTRDTDRKLGMVEVGKRATYPTSAERRALLYKTGWPTCGGWRVTAVQEADGRRRRLVVRSTTQMPT